MLSSKQTHICTHTQPCTHRINNCIRYTLHLATGLILEIYFQTTEMGIQLNGRVFAQHSRGPEALGVNNSQHYKLRKKLKQLLS